MPPTSSAILCAVLLDLYGHSVRISRTEAEQTCALVADAAGAAEVDAPALVALAWHESRFNGALRGPNGIGALQVTVRNLLMFGPDPVVAGATVFRRWRVKSRTDAQAVCRYRSGWAPLVCGRRGDAWARGVLRMARRIVDGVQQQERQ